MRNFKFLSITLCVCIAIAGISSLSTVFGYHNESSSTYSELPHEIATPSPSSRTNTLSTTDPINISSSSDWALYPFITGDGSDLTPYVIEGVEIYGAGVQIDETYTFPILNLSYNGIFIDTGENFIIKDCTVANFSVGIQFGLDVNITQIQNVTIDECGLGIYSWSPSVTLNISDCYILNCRWMSTAGAYNPEYYKYGGYGIWARSSEKSSIIQNCYVENCTFGILISRTTNITQNELINCGFFVEVSMLVISLPYIHDDNTVNGKPFKIFWHEDNLKIRQSDADQYGQMLFFQCDNLNIERVSITKPCSVGLYISNIRVNPFIGIESANGTQLTSIECANQAVGMYLLGYVYQARKLSVENCEIGYLIAKLRLCEFKRVSATMCTIPIFGTNQIVNTTIQLEPGTPFYYFDEGNLSHGFLVASTTSGDYFTVGNESTLEIWFQLNTTGTYAVTNLNLGMLGYIGFILEIQVFIIPGYNYLIIIGLIGISVVLYYRHIRKRNKK